MNSLEQFGKTVAATPRAYFDKTGSNDASCHRLALVLLASFMEGGVFTCITFISEPVFIKWTQHDAVYHKYPASNSYISTHLYNTAASYWLPLS